MNRMLEQAKTRRRFLKMLGASPLIAGSSIFAGSLASLLHAAPLEEEHFLGWLENLQQSDAVLSSPDQALDVMDFEPAARKAIPPAHFGYLATGVDSDATVQANRDGYSRIQIRSRRLVDVTSIDMSRTIFETKWDTPIVLSPVSAQKAFHTDGELGVARAAKTKGHLMMLSTVAPRAAGPCGNSSIRRTSGKSAGPSLSAPKRPAHRRLFSPSICTMAATVKLFFALSVWISGNAPRAMEGGTLPSLVESRGRIPYREASRNTWRGSRCLTGSTCRK